jgi:hypothetical protein
MQAPLENKVEVDSRRLVTNHSQKLLPSSIQVLAQNFSSIKFKTSDTQNFSSNNKNNFQPLNLDFNIIKVFNCFLLFFQNPLKSLSFKYLIHESRTVAFMDSTITICDKISPISLTGFPSYYNKFQTNSVKFKPFQLISASYKSNLIRSGLFLSLNYFIQILILKLKSLFSYILGDLETDKNPRFLIANSPLLS